MIMEVNELKRAFVNVFGMRQRMFFWRQGEVYHEITEYSFNAQ